MATMIRKVIASNKTAIVATITGVGNAEPGRRVPFELGWTGRRVPLELGWTGRRVPFELGWTNSEDES